MIMKGVEDESVSEQLKPGKCEPGVKIWFNFLQELEHLFMKLVNLGLVEDMLIEVEEEIVKYLEDWPLVEALFLSEVEFCDEDLCRLEEGVDNAFNTNFS